MIDHFHNIYTPFFNLFNYFALLIFASFSKSNYSFVSFYPMYFEISLIPNNKQVLSSNSISDFK